MKQASLQVSAGRPVLGLVRQPAKMAKGVHVRLACASSRRCLQPLRPCLTEQRSVRARAAFNTAGGMNPELKKSIDELISNNKIVVFMKGTREFPQCGFSNTVVQILNVLGAQYETVNILADERLRSGMKVYSQWPTFPQVYIDGEFYGGCDIMIEAYQSGALKETIEVVLNS